MPSSTVHRTPCDLYVAGLGDLAPLRTLVAAFRDHLGAARPADAELDAVLARVLADPATELCWARGGGGEPLGYTQTRIFPSLWASGLEAHLEDLFVVALARRRGVGRRLLDFALARARERGAAWIGLQTNERNESALRFYEGAGFRFQREALWGEGREVRLVKRLVPD